MADEYVWTCGRCGCKEKTKCDVRPTHWGHMEVTHPKENDTWKWDKVQLCSRCFTALLWFMERT